MIQFWKAYQKLDYFATALNHTNANLSLRTLKRPILQYDNSLLTKR